jgi:predicted lipid-binding transport protein (Tim44 family)
MHDMNASISQSRMILRMLQIVVAATAALTLIACETDTTGPAAADAPKALAASSSAPLPKSESQKPETPKTQAAKPAEPATDPVPMTHARAARECWMRTEKGNPREDLDKRADLVNKCIDEKMKAATGTTPKT